MAVLHVAQLNFLPAPEDLTPIQVLEQWHSLVDIAEAAASGGSRVSVVQAAARDDLITRNGIDYHFVAVGAADTPARRGRRIAGLLADIKPDVMHAHGLGFIGDAFAVSQCLPLPIIVQDHADRVPRWWHRAQWRRRYAAMSGVAFTAAELAQPYVRSGLFGPNLRVFAIPESSTRFTPGSRAYARADTGLYGDPCALWVGHLSPGKDPLSVLEGVALASARLPGLQLWCVFGSAPLIEAVQARVESDPRLAGRVHLLGRIPHPHVQSLMRAADLFVTGSRAESCGYAVLEALACGVLPVITDIPAFRALTGDGRVGHLWPCGDAARLAEALVDAASSPVSTAQVRAHFDATLSFAAVGRQWADAYAEVHAAHPRSTP